MLARVRLLAWLVFAMVSMAISFDLPAGTDGSSENHRCFALYIGKDVMVRGKYSVGTGANQHVSVEVTDADGSLHHKNEDATDDTKFSFTTHSYNDYLLCFTNTIDAQAPRGAQYVRSITFDVETGMDAADIKRIEQSEKLKPIEVEMRIIEQMLKGIVDEMEYLKEREIRMRDTNESTNERVQWLSLLSMSFLVASGMWQLYYLKRFFQSKKLM